MAVRAKNAQVINSVIVGRAVYMIYFQCNRQPSPLSQFADLARPFLYACRDQAAKEVMGRVSRVLHQNGFQGASSRVLLPLPYPSLSLPMACINPQLFNLSFNGGPVPSPCRAEAKQGEKLGHAENFRDGKFQLLFRPPGSALSVACHTAKRTAFHRTLFQLSYRDLNCSPLFREEMSNPTGDLLRHHTVSSRAAPRN